MNWHVEPATPEILTERVTWRYEPPYDVYDDDGKPVKNPERFFGERRIVLDVAEFNVRAQKVYERAGFVRTGDHVRRDIVWVDMELAE